MRKFTIVVAAVAFIHPLNSAYLILQLRLRRTVNSRILSCSHNCARILFLTASGEDTL
jgi:hypothetical protein